MLPINNGSPTHTSRSSGTESTPDITLIHASMMNKVSWEKIDDLNSDHHPIMITFKDHIPRVNDRPTYKWKLKDADWASYRIDVERNIPRNYRWKNINKIEKRLRKTIAKAANKHVGKKKVTENNKCYLTEEIKAEIKKRNKLRETVASNREEWIESCRKVAEMIKEEKEERYRQPKPEIRCPRDLQDS